jgi:hypothetical protein
MKEAGATLIRNKNHLVYELSNGKRLVMAKTPSDHRSTLNTITNLKKLVEN